MESVKRNVRITVGDESLSVHYGYRHFFTSNCVETYSKYLCLSDTRFEAWFIMDAASTDQVSFQFQDGPYEDQWMIHDGGYLYVSSKYGYLRGDLSDEGKHVKLWTMKSGTKHWFKRGDRYKNNYFGDHFYVTTTTNPSEALNFTLGDVSDLVSTRVTQSSPPTKAYFIKGDQYIQFDIATGKADEGYPKPIQGNWPGLETFTGNIGAVLDINREKIYLFSGSQWARYDAPTAQIDAGPYAINSGGWPGLDAFADGIDAAVHVGGGKVYFFKGAQYIRYNTFAARADSGYPKLIKDEWPGLEAFSGSGGIDAAIALGDGKIHFFKGSQYLRYDIASDKPDPLYPKPIKGNWNGLDAFADGIDAAVAF